MNSFGLSDDAIRQMCLIFQGSVNLKRVYLFGSRARGDFKENSDVDLYLEGEKLSDVEVLKIAGRLNEETTIPLDFDLISDNNKLSAEFEGFLKRDKVLFWERK